MPSLINFSRKHNLPLFERLKSLFQKWEDVSDPEQLAWLIAHQSALEMDIRSASLNRGHSAKERKGNVQRYLDTLLKARDIWLEMENDDQRALAGCFRKIDTGHLVTEVVGIELMLRSFQPTEDMAEWRKPALNKHQSWGPDTEMLDLLIGAAQLWQQEKAPRSHSKIDPTLYAVVYMSGICEQAGIETSPTPSSRFTEVVQAYFQHTFTGNVDDPGNKERTSFKDLIHKAMELRKTDYKDHFEELGS